MPGLSVTIITRDEEDRLSAAIRSVSFADEIVVLDCGSRDGTVALARALGARVIETDWPGHVAQKNRALAEARYDWVLALDADEWLSPALARSVREALANPPAVDGFTVNRRNLYLGRPLRGGRWYPDRRIRLARRAAARWGGEDPHDLLFVEGALGHLDGDLMHAPYRSLGEHLATLDRFSARFAEVSGARAGWLDLLLRPPWALFRALVLDRGFLDGALGLHLAVLGACHTALKWTRLYLKQRGHPLEGPPQGDPRGPLEG